MAEGWIKLYRSIRKNWIWEDAQKLKWWLDILLQANHQDRKVLLGNELVLIERGSFHTSELKLMKRWGSTKTTTRNFLDLLEGDQMITTIKTKKGTTIKITNYEDYQGYSNEENAVFKSEKTTCENSGINDLHMVYDDEKTILKPPKTIENLTEDKISLNNELSYEQKCCENSTTNEDSNTNGSDMIFDSEKTIKEPQKNHNLDHKRTIKEPQKNHKVYTNNNDKELYKNYKNEEEGKEGEEVPILSPLSFPTPAHKSILDNTTEVTYRTWFLETDIMENKDTAIILCPNDFIKGVIQDKYLDKLKTIFNKDVIVKLKEV